MTIWKRLLLRKRFRTREEQFVNDDCELQILLPEKAEDLLDEEAFARDERMPYWADLWPSAKALSRWLLDQDRIEGSAIELGCGVALPSIALRSRGIDVLATDYNDDALLFAQCNAVRNQAGALRTALFDWRNPHEFGRFDLVIAADVLYEQRNAIALADLLPNLVSHHGRFVLADPRRRWAEEFRERMGAMNWIERGLCVIEEPQKESKVPSKIQITEWTSPSLK